MFYDTLNVSEIYVKTRLSKSKGKEIADYTHGLKANQEINSQQGSNGPSKRTYNISCYEVSSFL